MIWDWNKNTYRLIMILTSLSLRHWQQAVHVQNYNLRLCMLCCVCLSILVTWSRRMSLISGMLILSHKLKEVINSYVLHCLGTSKNCPSNWMSNWDTVWSKCSIWNGQVVYIAKSKLSITGMWLIPLQHVTFFQIFNKNFENPMFCHILAIVCLFR